LVFQHAKLVKISRVDSGNSQNFQKNSSYLYIGPLDFVTKERVLCTEWRSAEQRGVFCSAWVKRKCAPHTVRTHDVRRAHVWCAVCAPRAVHTVRGACHAQHRGQHQRAPREARKVRAWQSLQTQCAPCEASTVWRACRAQKCMLCLMCRVRTVRSRVCVQCA